MTIRALKPEDWQAYFDRASKRIRASKTEIRVLAEDLGAQVEAEGMRLIGLAYDPNDGALEISGEELGHRIDAPTEILVDEEGTALRSLQVTGADGRKHVVRIEPLLSLPGEISEADPES